MLSKVEFEVEAKCNAVITSPSDQIEDLDLHHSVSKPEVVLVLAPGWPTDIGWQSAERGNEPRYDPIRIPPRAISVRAFPATANLGDRTSLRHVKDAYALEEAFRGSYQFVRQQLSQHPHVRTATGLQSPVPEDPSIHVDPLSYQSLPAADVSTLLHTVRTVFDPQFHWRQGMIDIAVKPLMVPLFVQYLLPWHKQHNELPDSIGQSSHLMLNYIILASILGAVSLFIRCSECEIDKSGLDMHLAYQHSFGWGSPGRKGLATCFTRVMSFLTRTMSEDVGGGLRYEWRALVLQVSTPWGMTIKRPRHSCDQRLKLTLRPRYY